MLVPQCDLRVYRLRDRSPYLSPWCTSLQAALQQLDARMQRFIPAFEQLVVLVQNRVRYPETLDKMRKDEIADFRRSRYSTADVLEDAAGGGRHAL